VNAVLGNQLVTAPDDADSEGEEESGSAQAAVLYRRLWHTLDSVLGGVATVTLLRRAARRAAPASPLLEELATSSVDEGFGYQLPRAFLTDSETPVAAVRDLVSALRPLLVELTGQVVVRQLDLIPGLRGPLDDARERTES
jgi:hypothetical protein